jgi:SAM-dependent methyltransferase
MRFDGADSYLSMGQIAKDTLIKFSGLTPESCVLDAGCGAGRAAIPFTTYLTRGSYEGFDIVPSWIHWCQRNITRKYPNVRFTWVDVYSKHYNSTGQITAETLTFPYNRDTFDCAMLLSVFTHMLPGGVRNYLHELSRVLKPGGRAFITALLLNDESIRGIEAATSVFPLRHKLGDCRVTDPKFPETTIAIPERAALGWCSESGLKLTIMYGSWPGRRDRETIHDSLVIEKVLHQ